MKPGDTTKRSLLRRVGDTMGKALTATPTGLLTLQDGRGGITASAPMAFAGSGFFGFPRSSFMDGYYYTLQNASYAYMWQTQPNLRQVVEYLAANWAQVPCDLIQDMPDGTIQVDNLHDAAASLKRPNDWQDSTELLQFFAADYFTFNNAYLVKIRPEGATTTTLIRVPAYAMGVRGVNKLRPDGYRIIYADGTFESLDPSEVIHWRGYNALDPRSGWSPIETLRQVMISEAMRQQADIEFNQAGRVKGGIIERPLESPDWDDEAAERFEQSWAVRARGANQGKSPILEDGMKWIDAGVTPREAEAIAAQEASVAAVCRMYNIHPALLGVGPLLELDSARKALNEDILPPLFHRCAGVLTRGLPEAEYDALDHRFKFDLTEKIEGNILDRMKTGVTIAGGAFMTRNEVRKRLFGLPPHPDGDDLIVPANVMEGGQPSPHVMPPGHATSGAGQEPSAEQKPPVDGPGKDKKAEEPERVRFSCARPALDPVLGCPERFLGLREPDGEVHTKAVTRRQATRERTADYAKAYTEIVRKHMRRQANSLAAKATVPALDSERWNAELADDLLKAMRSTVEYEGTHTGQRLMGGFDMGQVEHYLAAGSKAVAAGVNATTAKHVAEAVESASLKADAIDTADGVLAVAQGSRAEEIGKTLATSTVSFATAEAAKQNPGEGHHIRLKEWVGSTTGRHKNVAGEAVPVYSPFSNGMEFPGDPSADTEQCAGCDCVLDVF